MITDYNKIKLMHEVKSSIYFNKVKQMLKYYTQGRNIKSIKISRIWRQKCTMLYYTIKRKLNKILKNFEAAIPGYCFVYVMNFQRHIIIY